MLINNDIGYYSDKWINSGEYEKQKKIDENTLRCIKKNNIKVITSLYSSIPSIHDKITGVNGSFKLTVKNIKKLIENKCFVQANTVIMNYNHENIDDTIRYIHRLTNKKGKVDLIRNIGNSKEGFSSREICERCV